MRLLKTLCRGTQVLDGESWALKADCFLNALCIPNDMHILDTNQCKFTIFLLDEDTGHCLKDGEADRS